MNEQITLLWQVLAFHAAIVTAVIIALYAREIHRLNKQLKKRKWYR